MTDSLKAGCLVLLIPCAGLLVFVWMQDQPSQITWALRIGGALFAAVAVIALFIPSRPDRAPDYLHEIAGREFFDRDGFCFSFATKGESGVCFFEVYFQNRYERPCLGRIALRPTVPLFGKPEVEELRFEVACEPGAFGIVRLPIPIATAAQGKSHKYLVGAFVDYPQGRGKTLRFRDGIWLGANENFHDGFATALTVVGAMTGTLVWTSPASVTVTMPRDVSNTFPDPTPEVVTLWKLGEPPLSQPNRASLAG